MIHRSLQWKFSQDIVVDPRLLIVMCVTPFGPLALASVHAPHAGSTDESPEAFYNRLHSHLSSYRVDTVVGIDANTVWDEQEVPTQSLAFPPPRFITPTVTSQTFTRLARRFRLHAANLHPPPFRSGPPYTFKG
eukprot:11776488-Prorocentrum_lima.AAC.1